MGFRVLCLRGVRGRRSSRREGGRRGYFASDRFWGLGFCCRRGVSVGGRRGGRRGLWWRRS